MTDVSDRGARGILYLDVEGGWGGSSRSLFYLIESLDRRLFSPVVLLRKAGPVEARYKALGVPCHVMPELAPFRPSERKNLIAFAIFLWSLHRLPRLRRHLRHLIAERDVRLIHVNHESMVCIGAILARLFGLPWVGHVRTLLIPGWFARRVHRLMARSSRHVIFISEPNREHFRQLAGNAFDEKKTSVIHNIIPVSETKIEPLDVLMSPPDRFRVLSLTNFSPSRGVDRIVDVAAVLKSRGEQRFAFFLCGRPAHTKLLSQRPAPYFEEVSTRVRALGLESMVFLPGHVPEPERALAACDALIKLTRQANPWGRDIMEALAAGVPVVTLGRFQGFVENGVNGFIDEDFDPQAVADHLVSLASSASLRKRMSENNRAKAKALFSGPARAREVGDLYQAILGSSRSRPVMARAS